MSLASLGFLLVGLLALVGGAELVVRGASRVARAFGVSRLVVGLTLVAFGTSAPEVAVSVEAALSGRTGVALGNVVGSNIFNVLVVLGASALAAPLLVERQLVRLDVPIMIGVSLLPLLMGLNHDLSRTEGVILLVLGVVYTGILALLAFSTNGAADDAEAADGEGSPPPSRGVLPRLADAALIVSGLAALVIGADWLIEGATAIARGLGVSELVIGLTLVAAATSLPELATSVMAALRNERDIAVGNIVGSNIFNVLFVLGAAATAAPNGLEVPTGALTFDFPIMVAVAVACFPVFVTGWQISRWEGAVFLAYYGIYLTYLVLVASTHDARDEFANMALLFIVPLSVLLALGGWWWGGRRAEG